MLKDTRRICGPSETQSPLLYREVNEPPPLINTKGIRQDGRKDDEVRPIFMKSGVISQAQGSGYIEMSRTKVICAVYGPREVHRREQFSMNGILRCEFKFATFSCQTRRTFTIDDEEKQFALIIKEALAPAVCLHKFPKSQVDVFVEVLEDDGSALAAALTCSSLALADAGIEMYDVVTGCSLRKTGDNMLLDPTNSEEWRGIRGEDQGTVTVGLLPSLNQVCALLQRGEMSCDASFKNTSANYDHNVNSSITISWELFRLSKGALKDAKGFTHWYTSASGKWLSPKSRKTQKKRMPMGRKLEENPPSCSGCPQSTSSYCTAFIGLLIWAL